VLCADCTDGLRFSLEQDAVSSNQEFVMAGLVPAIHDFDFARTLSRGWPATSAAMTIRPESIPL
jgi:hypothetical protein